MTLTRRREVWIALCILALVGIGLVSYGFSLGLPLFWDDMVHFRWVSASDLGRIWSTPQAFSYYRPLPFTVWWLLWKAQGVWDAPLLHGINLGLHILNAILLLVLVLLQRRRGLAMGLAAGVVFLVFPFSYQAVPWVGALTHPLVTFLILGSLVCFLAAREVRWGKSVFKGTSLALAYAAPFTHQTGVMIPFLLLLVLLTAERPVGLRQAIKATLPYWPAALVGLGVAYMMPKEVGQPSLLNLETRLQNAVYFAQGTSFPTAPLADWVMRATGLPDLVAIALVTVPVILGGILVALWARRWKLAVLALGWVVLAGAPAFTMVGLNYLVDAPRLLYQASVGIALFWAMPLSIEVNKPRLATLVRLMAIAVALFAGVTGYWFIDSRQPLYEEMRRAVDDLRTSVGDAHSILVVNYPSWLAPRSTVFPIGHEGVVLSPEYTTVQDLLWVNTGLERPVTAVVMHDLRREGDYHCALAGSEQTPPSLQPMLRTVQRVLVTDYAGKHVEVNDAGGLEAQHQSPTPDFEAAFDERIALRDVRLTRGAEGLRLEMRWECWQLLDQDTTVFAHLYGPGGTLVSQADGFPLLGTARLTSWVPGDIWRDVRVIPLPDELTPGEYIVKVGLYPTDGGPRLVAISQQGVRFQDDAVPLGTVMIR